MKSILLKSAWTQTMSIFWYKVCRVCPLNTAHFQVLNGEIRFNCNTFGSGYAGLGYSGRLAFFLHDFMTCFFRKRFRYILKNRSLFQY